MKSRHLVNLGCENMRKKRIFDIEKVGFGDELKVKSRYQSMQDSNKAKANLDHERVKNLSKSAVTQGSHISKEVESPKSLPVRPANRIPLRNINYVSETFISPITGRKLNKPQVVHLAYGEYQLKEKGTEGELAITIEQMEARHHHFHNAGEELSDDNRKKEHQSVTKQIPDSATELHLDSETDFTLGEMEVCEALISESDLARSKVVTSLEDHKEVEVNEKLATVMNSTNLDLTRAKELVPHIESNFEEQEMESESRPSIEDLFSEEIHEDSTPELDYLAEAENVTLEKASEKPELNNEKQEVDLANEENLEQELNCKPDSSMKDLISEEDPGQTAPELNYLAEADEITTVKVSEETELNDEPNIEKQEDRENLEQELDNESKPSMEVLVSEKVLGETGIESNYLAEVENVTFVRITEEPNLNNKPNSDEQETTLHQIESVELEIESDFKEGPEVVNNLKQKMEYEPRMEDLVSKEVYVETGIEPNYLAEVENVTFVKASEELNLNIEPNFDKQETKLQQIESVELDIESDIKEAPEVAKNLKQELDIESESSMEDLVSEEVHRESVPEPDYLAEVENVTFVSAPKEPDYNIEPNFDTKETKLQQIESVELDIESDIKEAPEVAKSLKQELDCESESSMEDLVSEEVHGELASEPNYLADVEEVTFAKALKSEHSINSNIEEQETASQQIVNKELEIKPDLKQPPVAEKNKRVDSLKQVGSKAYSTPEREEPGEPIQGTTPIIEREDLTTTLQNKKESLINEPVENQSLNAFEKGVLPTLSNYDEQNSGGFVKTGTVHDFNSVIDVLNGEESVQSVIESLLFEDGLVLDGHDSDQVDLGYVTMESDLDINPKLMDEMNIDSVNRNLDQEQVVYYETPSLDLLDDWELKKDQNEDWIVEKMEILEQTFISFGVKVRLTGDFTQGPTVTQIEIQPETGTKMSKILGLYNDLKLNLSVEELRIEPIPGKNTIGIEVPNMNRRLVKLKEVLSRPEFILHESPLCIGLGEDIAGNPVFADILKMPHGLIAGQTGSGKSVCINTLLISILYKASPEDVRLLLIDPKRVELASYNDIPHLVTPVITDEIKAANGLKWVVDEMERRYELFVRNGVRDIKSFNNRRHEFVLDYAKLPYIVVIVDELADLMMVSAQEVEDYIMRITQKARAAGIHMIVATQRPTVDVITGVIKSNIPSRIAFAVAQANDSRVILDENGAQKLLGYGDMLWSQSGSKVKRVQGSYINDEEIERVVKHVKAQGRPNYLIEEQYFEKGIMDSLLESDPLITQAMDFFLDRGYATASSLQTRMSIGYNRAARIIDILEQEGLISEPQGPTRKREIKVTREELDTLFGETRG